MMDVRVWRLVSSWATGEGLVRYEAPMQYK